MSNWPKNPPSEGNRAERAAKAIVRDLSDRSCLRQAWELIADKKTR